MNANASRALVDAEPCVLCFRPGWAKVTEPRRGPYICRAELRAHAQTTHFVGHSLRSTKCPCISTVWSTLRSPLLGPPALRVVPYGPRRMVRATGEEQAAEARSASGIR